MPFALRCGMSSVFTLKQVMDSQNLGPGARAFCEALLKEGEVLAVRLNYLPDRILWLVTTPSQARLMLGTQPNAIILTLAEAADLVTSLGDPWPTSLWQVAIDLSAPAPDGSPEDPPSGDGLPDDGLPEDGMEDAADPWD
jgi:hypothetical protein